MRDVVVRQLLPQEAPKPVRFRERHRLVCPKGCEMRLRRERIHGGIHTCECGTKFVISGILEAFDGRDYYAIHHVTREHLERLDALPGMTTTAEILAVLGLD